MPDAEEFFRDEDFEPCYAIAGPFCKRRSCMSGGPGDNAATIFQERAIWVGTDWNDEGPPLDGWLPLERAYYCGVGETCENGDLEPQGAAVEVLGDDAWRPGYVRVRFPGSSTPTSVPAEILSRQAVPLRGGWFSLQHAYLRAASSDDASANGLLVKVIGDDPSRPGMLAVQIAGSTAIIAADPADLARDVTELSGGWQPLERAYFIGQGESFENGDTEPYGAAVVVLGNDNGWPGMLRVKFPRSRTPTAVEPQELSRNPVILNGGWLSLDVAYYASTRVEIIGDDHARPGMLTICFPDSGAVIVADPMNLARADAAQEAELGSGRDSPTPSAASTAVSPQAQAFDVGKSQTTRKLGRTHLYSL